ncbi:MAG: polysaccharide biosynthesis/export family protein [Alphaproteobacteria bacterium]
MKKRPPRRNGRMVLSWLAVLSFIVMALGAIGLGAIGTAQAQAPLSEYRLGPGDKLNIRVFGHADISGSYEVDSTGHVAMPLAGRLLAANSTIEDFQQLVTERLNRDLVVNPNVVIEVLSYRPFFILGEVQKPGSYPYIAGLSVQQAVALAGGYTRRARTATMTLVRRGPDGPVTLEVEPNTPVQPGDTIEIERRLF